MDVIAERPWMGLQRVSKRSSETARLIYETAMIICKNTNTFKASATTAQ